MTDFFANPLVVHTAIFLATSLFAVYVLDFLFFRADVRLNNRLRDLESDGESAWENPMRRYVISDVLLRPQVVSRIAATLVPNNERARSLIQAQLVRAGIHQPSAVAIFFAVRLATILLPPIFGVTLWLLGWVRLDVVLPWSTVLGGISVVLPGFWLHTRVKRRQHTLRTSLSDFLDLFVACVESGMSLQSMIGTVSEELSATHPELSSEFTICNRQLQFGHSLEASMADLAERTGLDDLRSFSTFVQQSARFGATIGTALRELSDSLRTARETRAEENAQKASVKILIPTLLFIFPAVFVVLAAPAAIRIHESLSQPSAEHANAAP